MGQHNIRVDDELWRQAGEKAGRDGRTLTDVIVTGLRGYLGQCPPVIVRPPVLKACPHPKARVIKGFCGACGTHIG